MKSIKMIIEVGMNEEGHYIINRDLEPEITLELVKGANGPERGVFLILSELNRTLMAKIEEMEGGISLAGRAREALCELYQLVDELAYEDDAQKYFDIVDEYLSREDRYRANSEEASGDGVGDLCGNGGDGGPDT